MLTKMTAADYMTTNLVKVGPDTEVSQAIQTLLDHKITSMPVVDENDKLLGVFSEKDGMRVVVASSYNQGLTGKVNEFMTLEPTIIDAGTSLVDVAVQFQETPTRSFPVFQNGELVGMISRIDVLKALLAPV
ncbi:MAG: CBS domain-containing protein [Methylococcales bacterium]|nr:CBS domain-containing protein [Methylococcales bacterium]